MPDADEAGVAVLSQDGQVTPRSILIGLADTARSTVTTTLDGDRLPKVATCYQVLSEFDSWSRALPSRSEEPLHKLAAEEYAMSLLCVCQGQYRNAFKSLRLVLELYLQGVALSADAVALHEWLSAGKDTSWAVLMNQDNGVFSKRFCRAFFAELDDKVDTFRTMSATLYRELSECVHGNIPNHIPLPSGMTFSADAFELWTSKVATLRLIVHFAFAMRYVRSLPDGVLPSVAAGLNEQLGHIPVVRASLGGPT